MRQAASRLGSLLAHSRVAAAQTQNQLTQLSQAWPSCSNPWRALCANNTTMAAVSQCSDGATLRLDSQISLLEKQREILPDLTLPGLRREMQSEIDIPSAAPKVLIEYDPCMLDTFLSLVEKIEDAIPHVLVAGNLGVPDGRPGSFEVLTEDGNIIYSKLSNPKAQLNALDVVRKLEHHLAEASFTP